MKHSKLKYFANILLFAFSTLLLLVVQTSVWYLLFGTHLGPNFWIPVWVYWAFARKTTEAILLSYLSVLIISGQSMIPIGFLLFASASVIFLISFIRQRIFWPGITYFMAACSFSVTVFYLCHWTLSWSFEANEIVSPDIWGWLAQCILTPFLAPILYHLFKWFDEVTEFEEIKEPGLI